MLIVLDLNGVLLHREKKGRKQFISNDNGIIAGRRTYVRPHAHSFITRLMTNHDVAIWSTAQYENVIAMLDVIGVDKSFFLFIWSHIECVRTNKIDEKSKPLLTKPLCWVWKYFPQFNEDNTIIIDDSFLKINMNPKKCVYIPASYTPDQDDNSLAENGEIDLILKTMQAHRLRSQSNQLNISDPSK